LLFLPDYYLWHCICGGEAILIYHKGENKVMMVEQEPLSGVKEKEMAAIMQP